MKFKRLGCVDGALTCSDTDLRLIFSSYFSDGEP